MIGVDLGGTKLLAGALDADLAVIHRTNRPVLGLIVEKLPVTAELAALAMVFALLIGIPAGVLSAVKNGTAWDYAANVFALWGLSTPNFWLFRIWFLVSFSTCFVHQCSYVVM